jgi:hypothetical protein
MGFNSALKGLRISHKIKISSSQECMCLPLVELRRCKLCPSSNLHERRFLTQLNESIVTWKRFCLYSQPKRLHY